MKTHENIVALFCLMLMLLAISGYSYSHWADNIYIEGRVKIAHWKVEKTFKLTVKHNVELGDVTYYGAVNLDSYWQSVELTFDGYVPLTEDKIYTGTISGLPPGIYEWKIYYVDNLWENHTIASGTENLMGSVINENTLGPTSLYILKTVENNRAKHENGFIYTIVGEIIVRNDPDYPAIVVDVSDTIEYKTPGFGWRSLTPISFDHNVPEIIPPGGPHYYTYTVKFSTENICPSVGSKCRAAWRNLIEITISNHPWGMFTFKNRESFSLPV